MTSTRFAPGPATAYVSDGVLAVTLAEGVDAELMSHCASIGEWSALLAVFADRTDAAVLMHSDELLRIAVVGAVEVEAHGTDGAHRVAGGTTWTTREIAGARAVTVRPSDAVAEPEPGYCVDAGAVPVAVVSRRLVTTADDTSDPFESLFGRTVSRTVEAAAVRPDDGDLPPPNVPLGVLVFSTGERVIVDRSMMLGRNPHDVDDDAIDTGVRRVRVASPWVSRQHAMIRVDRWHASIDDLGSSNGTRVMAPGRPVVTVRPGRPVDLVPGAVVDLGGDVSFAVEEVA